MQLTIHCDGGARGNPRPVASACVVLNADRTVVFQQGQYLGETTNNQAEYVAVKLALTWLGESDYNTLDTEVLFVLDSELVVKQIRGEYKVKDVGLQTKKREIDELLKKINIKKIHFKNVPRIENTIADSLVNQTLDAR